MKRLLSLLLITVLSIGLITGCDSADTETKSTEKTTVTTAKSDDKADEEEVEEKERVKIVLNLNGIENDDAGAAKAIELVPQMEKFSHVDFEFMDEDPDMLTKMPIAIASGEQQDIIIVANTINRTKFAEAGIIKPLDELIADAGYDFDDMFGNNVNLSKVGDDTVIAPIRRTTWLLYYNKALFDAAGVPYPDEKVPMTWTEYSEIAAKLTSGEGENKVYGALHLTWPTFWYGEATMKLGGGTGFYNAEGLSNIEEPIFATALERTYNMMHVDKSTPSHADVVISKIKPTAFMNGKYGMMISGSWILSWASQREEYPRDWKIGIAPMPVDEGTSLKSWGDTKGYAIPTTAAHPELALDIIVEMIKVGAEYANVDPHAYQKVKNPDLFVETAELLADDDITKEQIAYLLDNPDMELGVEKISGKNNVAYEKVVDEEVEKYFVKEQDLATTIANIKERGDKAILDD